MADPWAQFKDAPRAAPVGVDDPWAQFKDAPSQAATSQSTIPEVPLTDRILRQIALTGRAAAEGVAGTLALPDTLSTVIRNKARQGINALLGTHLSTDDPSWAQKFSNALTSAGAYTPQTSGEEMGSAVTRSVTGALTGGGAIAGATGAAMSVPNALRAAASGASGGAASEGTRQAGGGPLLQTVAGIAGGATPAAVEGLTRVGVQKISGLLRPLTRSGQQTMAAQILQNQATDPQAAAANLDNAAPIIPGSPRTMGESSQDPGLLALEKGIRGRNTADFGQVTSAQNTARQAAMQQVGGTEADISAAEAARNQETSALRENAMNAGGTANVRPVLLKIDRILDSPIGKRDIPSQALNWLKDKLSQPDDTSDRFMTPSQMGKLGRETFEPRDPANLYAIRQDINDAIAGKLGGEQSKFRLAQSTLIDIRHTLDDAIEGAAPGFKAYLQRYSELSKPINQMEVMQEIGRRANTTATDMTTGQPFMGSSGFTRALDNALQDPQSRLTPGQIAQLRAVQADLQAGQAINSPLVKAPGSDTFQNLSIAQVLGAGPGGPHPSVRFIGKAFNWLYKAAGSDERVNEIIKDAALDPNIAAALLRRATPSTVSQFSLMLKRMAVGAGYGSLVSHPEESGPQAAGTGTSQ